MARRDLQHEIHQRVPFRSPEIEATLNLMRTHDVLESAFAQLFKAKGLSHAKYNLLRILRGADRGGLPCLAIRDRMLTRVPDVTRLVDRLDSLDTPVEELHRAQLRHLSRTELEELNRLLVKARKRQGDPS